MTNLELKNEVTNELSLNLFWTYTHTFKKLTRNICIEISDVVYQAYFNDELKFSEESSKKISEIVNLSEIDNKEEFIKSIVTLYNNDLRDRVSYYINATINGFPMRKESRYISPSHRPVGPNDAIYEYENRQTRELRKRFLKVMPL